MFLAYEYFGFHGNSVSPASGVLREYVVRVKCVSHRNRSFLSDAVQNGRNVDEADAEGLSALFYAVTAKKASCFRLWKSAHFLRP